MRQPFILGVDIGTGSTKAVAVDLKGEGFAAGQSYYPTTQPKAGFSEQDPESIWKAFTTAIDQLIQKVGYAPMAVSLSSVMHSLIPVDAEGKALHPMITWVDARSAAIAAAIRDSAEGASIYNETGTPVFAMSPLSKIIWLKENQPYIFNRAYKFISIKEYIWYKLFSTFEVDHSVASGSGLFNIHTLSWHSASLALAGISASQLSIPVATGYVRNDFRKQHTMLNSIPHNTAFVIGGSDGCLANLGSLAIENRVAAITIGTSGAVRLANKTPVQNFPAMTFNYRLDEEQFICGGPVNNGGIAVQWQLKNYTRREELTPEDYVRFFEGIDAIPAGAEGLLFLPYLTGERAPVWDTESSGVFFGIRLHHRPEHFSRAVLEGVCYGLKQVLETLEAGSEKVLRVHVSGGFVTSKTWVQLLADVTGKEMVIVHAEDASAIGAAMIAMKALNLVPGYDFFLKEKKLVSIWPDVQKHDRHKKNFVVFKQLYAQLKNSMHLLHQVNS